MPELMETWWSSAGPVGNPTRTNMAWFFLNSHLALRPVPVMSICGDLIERNSSTKYLGVKMDCSLRFKEHVNHLTTAAMKGFHAIKMMTAANLEQYDRYHIPSHLYNERQR